MMSIVAAGARPTRKAFPKTKGTLVVAVALLALLAFAALISASEAPNVEHSYVAARSTPDQSGTASPVSSEPQAAPQMSKKEALDAYEKLPLSFTPTRARSPIRRCATTLRAPATASSSAIRACFKTAFLPTGTTIANLS